MSHKSTVLYIHVNVIFIWGREGVKFVLQNNYNLLSSKKLVNSRADNPQSLKQT